MQRFQASTVKTAAFVALFGAAGIVATQWAPNSGKAPESAAEKSTASAPSATSTAIKAVSDGAAAVAEKTVATTTSAAAAVAAMSPAAPAAIRFATPAAATAVAFTSESALRKQIKFETVKWGGEKVKTLDEPSRLLLAQAAAAKAGLHKVGLSYEDVYGVIEAETSWIPRTGLGKNGVTSIGLAQFEPRTARGLGLKDPNDPVQAVLAAAVNMKHGAEWAADRIDHLELSPEEYQARLREGVSIYYNLSIKGRNKWNGLNTEQMPVETQRHIRNVRAGAAEANELAGKLLDA